MRRLVELLVVAGCAPACSSVLGITDPIAGQAGDAGTSDSRADAGLDARADAAIDAAPEPDAPPFDPAAGSPLLLSEVVLTPTDGELIELVNITDQRVDLSRFFLTDSGSYFRLPGGAPVLDNADFIAKFPAGASVPAHGVVTVAVSTTTDFLANYGIAPTFSIADGTMEVVAAAATPNLTNGGELVAVFFWDGATDVVADADLVLAGSPSAVNAVIDKSGVQIDGPDGDAAATAYAIDARSIGIQMGTPGAGESTKRIAREAGHEVQDGAGNGLGGDDETSEDTGATWDAVTFSAPTPGAVPPALLR